MEEPREGDCRVPLISTLLFLLVAAGGVLLFIYVFKPSLSKPWFPVASFLLIGSPWIFWLLTYMYTCIKACVRSHRQYEHQISRRSSVASSSHARSSTTSSHNNSNNNKNKNNANGRNELTSGSAAANQDRSATNTHGTDNDDDGKHVHFGGVLVMDRDLNKKNAVQGHGGNGQNPSSVTSSREIEMPLTLSVSS